MGKKCTLYKYISINNHSCEILENKRLYCSRYSDLNDPFEMLNCENQYLDSVRIVSLTNSYLKKLMWAHYADSHKGACLTIELEEADVTPVVYTSKRFLKEEDFASIIDGGLIKNKRNITLKIPDGDVKVAVLKDKKWNDELEYRIIINTKDSNNLNEKGIIESETKFFYNNFKIKSITLGNCFNKNKKENIERFLLAIKNLGI
ncbi:MAG: DUF2971 domain-containing protein, partial [Anaeroplasmataceae bacterium]|nr:DUF2971 domain-containing protein [Anaeroplasmataceae bacterium]